jgi:peptide/nickel transport system substrate-binding protein
MSCAPAATPTPTPAPTGTPSPTLAPKPTEEKEMVRDALGKLVEKPQYGGTITRMETVDNLGFDEAFTPSWYTHHDDLVYDEPLTGDWKKGPLGTNETIWFASFAPLEYETGSLAESWEFPDPKTIVLHIRKGIRWQDKPPVNGRELVADDIAFTLTHHCQSPTSYQAVVYPGWFVSATATDKWTVVIKGSDKHPLDVAQMWDKMIDTIHIIPREVIQKYGDLKDWRNQVGTGPFMLTDYVPNSMQYFKKNPNYWGKDPLHPQNPLPYVDAVRILIIPDKSTQIAALRTAKVDHLKTVSWDERESLRKTNPELREYKVLYPSSPVIAMRIDRPDEPFDDIRVRKALALAIDRQAIAKKFYGGPAEILAYISPPAFKSIYIPLEQLPAEIRQLYEYQPDQAKQLLAEAGYPKGFKAEIICQAADADQLSLVKDYWAKIGVDLDIQVKEYAVFIALTWTGKQHKHMVLMWESLGYPYKLLYQQPGFLHNASMVNDPYINERYTTIWAFENMQKPDIRDKALKECMLRALSQVYGIQLPTPYIYYMWQPWLKGYDGGVDAVGYCNWGLWVKYAWVDQDMKKAMGY